MNVEVIVCTVILQLSILAVGIFLHRGNTDRYESLFKLIANMQSDNNGKHDHTHAMIQKATLSNRPQLPETWQGDTDVMPTAPLGLDDVTEFKPVTDVHPRAEGFLRRKGIPELEEYTPTPSATIPPTHAMHRPQVQSGNAPKVNGAEERERLQRAQLSGEQYAEPRRIG